MGVSAVMVFIRYLLAAALALAPLSNVTAGWFPLVQAGAGGSYTGPGDVQATGKFEAFGVRAFSSATRGTKLLNVCNSTGGTDVGCGDLFSDATTGALVPATVGGITCPASGVTICTVKIAYDLSASNRCTGSCDMSQATVASRPTLRTGSTDCGTPITGACIIFSGTQTLNAAANVDTQAQPISVVSVFKVTDNTNTTRVAYGPGGGSNPQIGANAPSGIISCLNNGNDFVSGLTVLNKYLVTQDTVNGTQVNCNVNGTLPSGNPFSDTGSFGFGIPSLGASSGGSNPFIGVFLEGSVFLVDMTAAGTTSTMNSNVQSFYGAF